MTSMYPTPLQRVGRPLLWLVVTAIALDGAGAVGPVLTVYVALAAATLTSGWCGVALVRLALAIHASRKSYGPCRGAGFLGVGVLVTGTATLTAGVVAYTTGVEWAAAVPAVGAFAAAPAYLLGLLLLPGAAPTLGARLRRAVDGLGIGISLLYAAWLVLVREHGTVSPLHLAVAIVCCLTLSVAVITGVRAVRHRPAALACATGTGLSMLGLTLLADQSGPAGSAGWLAVAGLALVGGPLLVVAGARRADDGPREAHPAESSGTFAAYPLLALPVGAAVAATVYHAANGGTFDRTAVLLGVVGVTVIAVREALAAIDLRRYAGRLASQEAQFRLLVGGSADVIAILDTHLTVKWLSPAAARQFGLSEQDLLGQRLGAHLHPDDAPAAGEVLAGVLAGTAVHAAFQARLRDGFGSWRETEATVADHRDNPLIEGLVVRISDVGERAHLRRSLDRLTWVDELTGLANRRKLLAAATDLRTADTRTGEARGALLVVRFERLAAVIDLHGAAVGDAVLVEAARRLRSGTNTPGGTKAPGGRHSPGEPATAADLAARLSPDAFAVLTAASTVRAYALATRLLTVLAEPYEVPGRTVHLVADIGVAELSGGADVEDVLRHAELARRRARQLGRGRAECYDASLEAALVRRTAIEQHLPGVVSRNELDLVYQPVMDLTFQQPVGVESLLRWRDPRLGYVLPAEFLPVAAEFGLADEIGRWVLHQACRQLSRWRRDGRDLWMSVNVSQRELVGDGFLAAVATALDTHDVPADRLVVEVEVDLEQSDPLDHAGSPDASRPRATRFVDAVAVDRLAALRALGVRTALDHFGASPTALAHLRRLPVDILKIDRVLFSEPAGQTGPAAPIVEVVVGLARRLGIEVIAAGLEAESHADVVKAAGCRLGQGFLLAQPGHAEHVEAFLESHRAPLL